jgi:hypothetical protein
VKIGREVSEMEPASSFITADGTLWNASPGELRRFENGRWKKVERLPWLDSPSRLIPLNADGPPWLLLGRLKLWRLGHGAHGSNAQLTPVDIREGEIKYAVSAGMSLDNRSLLLATSGGLRLYDPATETLSKIDLEAPPGIVEACVRDGLGRVWLGGTEGLWMVDAGGKTLIAFDGVPWIRRNPVEALASDPRHKDGVIVALGSRGVVFLRATRTP